MPTLPLNLREPGTGPRGCDPHCGGPYKSKGTALLAYNQLVHQLFKLPSGVFEVLKTSILFACSFYFFKDFISVCLFLTFFFLPHLGIGKDVLL